MKPHKHHLEIIHTIWGGLVYRFDCIHCRRTWYILKHNFWSN